MIKKPLTFILITAIVGSSLTWVTPACAQDLLGLPEPGHMMALSPAYQPVLIQGLTVHKDNPFQFDFLVDKGQDRLEGEALKREGERLINYFLASLAVPEQDMWVNLSPYEHQRTVTDALGQTEMGRDLLAQDYILKQITASLLYPEHGPGKEFWNRVYAEIHGRASNINIPVNTFNKVWIVADKAEIFERGQTAFVVGMHLKVMLEEDYLAEGGNKRQPGDMFNTEPPRTCPQAGCQANEASKAKATEGTNDPGTQVSASTRAIIRDVLLPIIEKEVNEGKNFAALRQISHALLLASWYKKNLEAALLNQVYSNTGRVSGIDLTDKTIKDQIYQRYLQAYKKGVFNFIKEEPSANASAASIPRKYFSGGWKPGALADFAMTENPQRLNGVGRNGLVDFAMTAQVRRRVGDDVGADPRTFVMAKPANTDIIMFSGEQLSRAALLGVLELLLKKKVRDRVLIPAEWNEAFRAIQREFHKNSSSFATRFITKEFSDGSIDVIQKKLNDVSYAQLKKEWGALRDTIGRTTDAAMLGKQLKVSIPTAKGPVVVQNLEDVVAALKVLQQVVESMSHVKSVKDIEPPEEIKKEKKLNIIFTQLRAAAAGFPSAEAAFPLQTLQDNLREPDRFLSLDTSAGSPAPAMGLTLFTDAMNRLEDERAVTPAPKVAVSLDPQPAAPVRRVANEPFQMLQWRPPMQSGDTGPRAFEPRGSRHLYDEDLKFAREVWKGDRVELQLLGGSIAEGKVEALGDDEIRIRDIATGEIRKIDGQDVQRLTIKNAVWAFDRRYLIGQMNANEDNGVEWFDNGKRVRLFKFSDLGVSPDVRFGTKGIVKRVGEDPWVGRIYRGGETKIIMYQEDGNGGMVPMGKESLGAPLVSRATQISQYEQLREALISRDYGEALRNSRRMRLMAYAWPGIEFVTGGRWREVREKYLTPDSRRNVAVIDEKLARLRASQTRISPSVDAAMFGKTYDAVQLLRRTYGRDRKGMMEFLNRWVKNPEDPEIQSNRKQRLLSAGLGNVLRSKRNPYGDRHEVLLDVLAQHPLAAYILIYTFDSTTEHRIVREGVRRKYVLYAGQMPRGSQPLMRSIERLLNYYLNVQGLAGEGQSPNQQVQVLQQGNQITVFFNRMEKRTDEDIAQRLRAFLYLYLFDARREALIEQLNTLKGIERQAVIQTLVRFAWDDRTRVYAGYKQILGSLRNMNGSSLDVQGSIQGLEDVIAILRRYVYGIDSGTGAMWPERPVGSEALNALIRDAEQGQHWPAPNPHRSAEADRAQAAAPGGIDLSRHQSGWNTRKEGEGVSMAVDQALIARIKREGIDGLIPRITAITPVDSIWPLIGLPGPSPN